MATTLNVGFDMKFDFKSNRILLSILDSHPLDSLFAICSHSRKSMFPDSDVWTVIINKQSIDGV